MTLPTNPTPQPTPLSAAPAPTPIPALPRAALHPPSPSPTPASRPRAAPAAPAAHRPAAPPTRISHPVDRYELWLPRSGVDEGEEDDPSFPFDDWLEPGSPTLLNAPEVTASVVSAPTATTMAPAPERAIVPTLDCDGPQLDAVPRAHTDGSRTSLGGFGKTIPPKPDTRTEGGAGSRVTELARTDRMSVESEEEVEGQIGGRMKKVRRDELLNEEWAQALLGESLLCPGCSLDLGAALKFGAGDGEGRRAGHAGGEAGGNGSPEVFLVGEWKVGQTSATRSGRSSGLTEEVRTALRQEEVVQAASSRTERVFTRRIGEVAQIPQSLVLCAAPADSVTTSPVTRRSSTPPSPGDDPDPALAGPHVFLDPPPALPSVSVSAGSLPLAARPSVPNASSGLGEQPRSLVAQSELARAVVAERMYGALEAMARGVEAIFADEKSVELLETLLCGWEVERVDAAERGELEGGAAAAALLVAHRQAMRKKLESGRDLLGGSRRAYDVWALHAPDQLGPERVDALARLDGRDVKVLGGGAWGGRADHVDPDVAIPRVGSRVPKKPPTKPAMKAPSAKKAVKPRLAPKEPKEKAKVSFRVPAPSPAKPEAAASASTPASSTMKKKAPGKKSSSTVAATRTTTRAVKMQSAPSGSGQTSQRRRSPSTHSYGTRYRVDDDDPAAADQPTAINAVTSAQAGNEAISSRSKNDTKLLLSPAGESIANTGDAGGEREGRSWGELVGAGRVDDKE
ncbi:hypothetical protein IAT38_002027 [Cryptococcus sp. DSM 104549]